MAWLLEPAWPPLAAIAAATFVFLWVAVRTPPGLAAAPDLFNGGGQRALVAAYMLGSATILALGTLVLVGAVLLGLSGAIRALRRATAATRGNGDIGG